MTGQDRENLIICIENAAAFISEANGYETVAAASTEVGCAIWTRLLNRSYGNFLEIWTLFRMTFVQVDIYDP